MDVKKVAAILAATAMVGAVSLTASSSRLVDHFLSVSAATYLKLTSSGDTVKRLQQNLIALNYLKSGQDTGTFDEATDGAVRNLQTDYCLKVDGIAGPDTIALVDGLVSASAKIVRVDAGKLNVRASTNTSSEIISTVERDQKLIYDNVLTSGGEKWYHISVGEMKGFVKGQYVEVVKLSPVSSAVGPVVSGATSSSGGRIRVTGTILNVRASASTSARKITTLSKGQAFAYTNVKRVGGVNWYYIKVNDSTSGWVMGSFVSVIGSNQTAGRLRVTGTTLNVRSDAGLSASKITAVKKGETYSYTDIRTVDGINWYKITLSNGSGWVLGTYVSLTSTESPSSGETGSLRVTGSVLNVRAGTSTSTKKVSALRKGQTVTYSDTKTVNGVKWYNVRLSDSLSGWVIGTYVSPTANAAPTTTSTTATTTTTAAQPEHGKLKVKGDVVRVRSGAGTNYDKITEVRRGKEYTYSDYKDGWYCIQLTADQTGWICGDFVEATPATTVTTTTTATRATNPPETGTLTVTGASVNVRAGVGTDSKSLATVRKGDTLSYIDKKNGWYQVKLSDGKTGWISGEFVDASADATTTTATTTATTAAAGEGESGSLVVKGNLVRVRGGAGTDAEILTEVRKGEKYSYDDVKDNWFHIRLSDDQSGWICGDYIEATPDETTTTKPSETTPTEGTTTEKPAETTTTTAGSLTPTAGEGNESGKLTVVKDGATVYSAADASSEKLLDAPKDKEYEYVDLRDGWYRVLLDGTHAGWIHRDDVKATPDAPSVTAESGTLAVTTDAASVYEGADSSAAKLTEVAKDKTYPYDKVSGDWYHIQLDAEHSGWIHKENVKATPSVTTPAPSETTTAQTTQTETTTKEPTTTTKAPTVGRKVTVGTVKLSSGVLNVRSGAGGNYPVIGTLAKNKTVVIVTKGNKWHKIEYGNTTGYVSADYIKDIKTTYEDISLAFETDYYYVNKSGTVSLKLTGANASVTYTSSDPVRCPVSNKGEVSGKSAGLYTITAKSGSVSATTCVVVLREPNADVQSMEITPEGVKFIADWEGSGTPVPVGDQVELRFYPYKDEAGFWTVGYGHAKTTTASKSWSKEKVVSEFNEDITRLIGPDHILTDAKPYLTQEEAMAFLKADLNDGYSKSVSDWAVRNGVELSQQQFDALVSFCFNMGTSLWQNDANMFYLKSAILAQRSGDEANADQVIEGFCRYIKAGGKYYKGLWYRRRNEAELFLEGDYQLDRQEKFTLPSDVNWS